MSEKISTNNIINSRLENWDAKKTAQEKNKWEDSLYADAGLEDFSDDAKNRITEADAYEKYMENFASDNRSSDVRYFDMVEKGELPDNAQRLDGKISEVRELSMMGKMADSIAALNFELKQINDNEQAKKDLENQINIKKNVLNKLISSYDFGSDYSLLERIEDRLNADLDVKNIDEKTDKSEISGGQVQAVADALESKTSAISEVSQEQIDAVEKALSAPQTTEIKASDNDVKAVEAALSDKPEKESSRANIISNISKKLFGRFKFNPLVFVPSFFESDAANMKKLQNIYEKNGSTLLSDASKNNSEK